MSFKQSIKLCCFSLLSDLFLAKEVGHIVVIKQKCLRSSYKNLFAFGNGSSLFAFWIDGDLTLGKIHSYTPMGTGKY